VKPSTTALAHASNADLLALVLGDKRLANRLLKEANGSLYRLLYEDPGTHACVDFFCAEGRISSALDPAVKLRAARELAARGLAEELRGRDCLTSPNAVRDFLKHRLAGLPHEVFIVLHLDAQHQVIAAEELFRGTLTQTSVYPREVVKACMRANSAAVILAHNHPSSGDPHPSQADELLTRALKDALALVDVKVLDHFVVAGTQTCSFSERGLI